MCPPRYDYMEWRQICRLVLFDATNLTRTLQGVSINLSLLYVVVLGRFPGDKLDAGMIGRGVFLFLEIYE